MLDLKNVKPYLGRGLPLTQEAQNARGWGDIPAGADYAPHDPLLPMWLGSGVGLPELRDAIMHNVPPLESTTMPKPVPTADPARGNRVAGLDPIAFLTKLFL